MTTESYQFQADIHQLLQMMVHSLYSNPDVFLRELISNASDAMDKLHVTSLTRPPLVESQHPQKIYISIDPQKKMLIVEDGGIGLTKEEIQTNLGTIAHSGTKKFLEHLKQQPDAQKALSLIGQFGVGFYSVFMVADQVVVETRSAYDASGWRWIPSLDGHYNIEPWESEKVGTRVILYLKKSAEHYLNHQEIERLVKRYSNYIQYPILWFENDKETKQINQGLAIWRHKLDQVTPQQQEDLFHQLGGFGSPLLVESIHLEGTVEFKSMIFVPEQVPFDLFEQTDHYGPRLMSHGVLIQEACKDLLPPFLRFVKGIVETEDLDLNVSREILQSHPNIAVIRKSLTKKILQAFQKLSHDREKYQKFVETFGMMLKEGLHTAPEYRDTLLELVRYPSSKQGSTDWVSLKDYVSRMKEGQKEIYVLSAPNFDAAQQSPHQEKAQKDDIEVLYWLDPIDEWLVWSLDRYKEYPFKLLHKVDDHHASKDDSGQWKIVLEKIKEVLSEFVQDVRLADHLVDSPACVRIPKEGIAHHVELMFYSRQQNYQPILKVFEINPHHSLIQSLKEMDDASFKERVWFLFNAALLHEGIPLKEPTKFVKMIYNFLERKKQ